MLLGSMRGDVILFSTARQTPSEVWIPMAVEPSWKTPPQAPAHTNVQLSANSDLSAGVLVWIQLHHPHTNPLWLCMVDFKAYSLKEESM